jgi:predicted GNAT family acetyltransferase
MSQIIHDKENKKFILPLENNLFAKVEYSLDDTNTMRLIYSETPPQLRGQGIGKELVEKTFEKLTKEGYKAIAVCSYIRAEASRSEKWKGIIKH